MGTSDAEKRRALRKRAFVVLFVSLLIYAGYVGYSLFRFVSVVIPHSYAAWTIGDLLVEYMDTHEGNWPAGWNDLEEARDSLLRKGRNIYYDFDKLPEIARIDWTADPSSLARALLTDGERNLKVVTQIDGSRLEANWGQDTEPNRKVAQYLIRKHVTPPTSESK